MIRLCVTSVAALSALAIVNVGCGQISPILFIDAGTPDNEAIVGVWETTTATINGQAYPVKGKPDLFTGCRFEFDGKNVRQFPSENMSKEQRTTILHSYRIDASSNPKQIEVQWAAETPLGKMPPTVFIYKLDNDTLVLCWALTENAPPPTTFESKPDQVRALVECRRVRE